MAKRREYDVVTKFLTRDERVRAIKPSLRGALREATRLIREDRFSEVHVVKQGSRGQKYEAVCTSRDYSSKGVASRSGKPIARCFIWKQGKKSLKASKRALYRTRKKYG